MISSFYLMNVSDTGYSEIYQVEFLINNDVQSLLTIGVIGGKIQNIECHPVYASTKIKLVEDTRRDDRVSFIYAGEYFTEDRILYMIGKACDEYDNFIESMTSIKPADVVGEE